MQNYNAEKRKRKKNKKKRKRKMFQEAFPMLESDSLFIARRVGIYRDKSENKGENGRFLSYIELGWVMGEGEAFSKILNSPPTRKKTKNKKKKRLFPPKRNTGRPRKYIRNTRHRITISLSIVKDLSNIYVTNSKPT